MSNRLLNPKQSVLVIVDIQEKFYPILWEAERLVEKTRTLLEIAGKLDIPVLLSEQYPQGLGPTVAPLLEAMPEQTVRMTKTAFGCLEDFEMKKYLSSLQRKQVIVCGIEAHICVNQTVHQLLAAGYEPHLIQDAISSRSEENYHVGIAKMTQSGAIPSCVEMCLFELMTDAAHPLFKPLQSLIR